MYAGAGQHWARSNVPCHKCKRVQAWQVLDLGRFETCAPGHDLQVWLVEDGHVERYDGYFADYKDELVKEISAEMDEDDKKR